MTYTPAQLDAATAALVAAIHGLHPDVARAWATAEQGVSYNILGVTYTDATGQHLYRYGSWAQGAQAAANLIAHGPYAGIRQALANGTSASQAAAIIASPWNHPYYSGGAGAQALRAIAAQHTPPPPKPLTPPPPTVTYTVRPGDCLWGIAAHFYGNGSLYGRIATANGIRPPFIIHPGDRLRIPSLRG